ncbi:MAG: DNA translocase FtsK 4TM domain-containing protein [Alphaproteobacteria bacterium]
MPRTAQISSFGWDRLSRRSGELRHAATRQVLPALGIALMVASALLCLALLTYNQSDPSLDTAAAAPPRNYLGYSGAVVADLLLQYLGLAAYLLPAAILGWAFGLLLQHPLRRPVRKLMQLVLALALGAAAFAILRSDEALSGAGGLFGSLLLGLAGRAGLGALELPLAMVAAALVGPLLLSIIGLSAGQWRHLGSGAGRGAGWLAVSSGRGSAVLGGYLLRTWRAARPGPAPNPARPGTGARDPRAGAVVTLPQRREPRVEAGDGVPAAPRLAGAAPASDEAGGRLVRLVLPRAKPDSVASRAEHDARPSPDRVPPPEPVLPSLGLLTNPPAGRAEVVDDEALARNARMLETVLEDYGVRGQIVQVRPGPVVTLYELEPAPGIKASRVIGLADDIARSMSAISVRVAVVPGRTVIGIELPNRRAETVYLRELLASPAFEKHGGRLVLALGKDISGEPVIADLARMPHLLIAGTTGSGKSVGINTMILSILYRMPPDTCKFIMIDPKMLELSVYDGIPHLLSPVVTDPKKAVLALKWTVREMESRYQKMSRLGVRNIDGFNARVREAAERGESLTRKVQTGFDAETGEPVLEEQPFDASELPLVVVVVDEMADLMLVAGKEIEAAVQRLAQMARAAGIHLITATQRPSVDVITGTIKANFPTRISFQVTSKIDSRTILGEGGAEQLLGRGDMLYMAGGGRVTRVHGPFVSDEEVERVVSFLKAQGAPDYIDDITEDDGAAVEVFGGDEEGGSGNELYDQAVALVTRERKASTSFVQRHLQIGYNRAAKLIERMEAEGVVSGANHVGKREVLAPAPGR